MSVKSYLAANATNTLLALDLARKEAELQRLGITTA